MISASTASGRLLVQVREQPCRGPTIVDVLRHLVRHTAGKLLMIWDGAPSHRVQPVNDFLATDQGQRVHPERLPAYAPELNPDAGIGQQLQRVELRNLVCHALPEV